MQDNKEFIKKRLEHIKRERAEHIDRTGQVVVGVNEIQFIAGYLISLLYFEKADFMFRLRFIQGVTSNKYSNFKLVTDILRNLLLEKFPGQRKYFIDFCEKIDDLGEIRNKFAHEFLMHGNAWLPYFASRKKEHIPWNQEGVEVDALFKDFTELHKKIEKELRSIINIREVEIALDRDRSVNNIIRK